MAVLGNSENDGNFWEYVEMCRRKEYAPFVDTLDYLK